MSSLLSGLFGLLGQVFDDVSKLVGGGSPNLSPRSLLFSLISDISCLLFEFKSGVLVLEQLSFGVL